jgi:Activator of Hsp90 ATPase homolog 1-like protein
VRGSTATRAETARPTLRGRGIRPAWAVVEPEGGQGTKRLTPFVIVPSEGQAARTTEPRRESSGASLRARHRSSSFPGPRLTFDVLGSRSMLHVCPTEIVHAPAERLWHLVTTPSDLARWSDTTVIEAPDRDLRPGDHLVLGAGVGHLMKVIFRVLDVVPPRRLALHIRLPFGVTNHEVVEIAPIGGGACRVTFN